MEEKKKEKGTITEVIERQTEKPEQEDIEIVNEIAIRDEDQIKRELIGETTREYFYQFKLKGRTVTGISIKGINEIARSMGNLHVTEPKIAEHDEKFVVKVEVKDLLRNMITWGVSSQSKRMKTRESGLVDDEFALQKAFSKARRNALRQLIPETLISKMFEKWKEVSKQHVEDAKQFM